MYKLAVDFDGTMSRYEDGLRFIVAKAKGIDPSTIPPADSWDFKNWNMERGEFMEHHTNFVRSGGFKNLVFYPGVLETLTMLKWDDVHISIVTHRLMVPGESINIVKDTMDNLAYARIPFDDILFVEDKSVVDFDLLIDDAPKHHESCTAVGKNVLIFDQLYNRHLDGPRVHGWTEAYEYVSKHKFDLDKLARVN